MAVAGLPTLFEEENLQKRRILKVHEEEKSELYKQIGKLTRVVEKKICTIRFVTIKFVNSSILTVKSQ